MPGCIRPHSRRRSGLSAPLLDAVLVGSGGFLGAVFRHGLSGFVHRRIPTTFPYGTLAVNLLGCFLIGLLAGFVASRQLLGPDMRRFAMIGLLGGFTTWSAFGYETFVMLRGAEYFRAAGNVGAHVVLGLGLVWAGYALTGAR